MGLLYYLTLGYYGAEVPKPKIEFRVTVTEDFVVVNRKMGKKPHVDDFNAMFLKELTAKLKERELRRNGHGNSSSNS